MGIIIVIVLGIITVTLILCGRAGRAQRASIAHEQWKLEHKADMEAMKLEHKAVDLQRWNKEAEVETSPVRRAARRISDTIEVSSW